MSLLTLRYKGAKSKKRGLQTRRQFKNNSIRNAAGARSGKLAREYPPSVRITNERSTSGDSSTHGKQDRVPTSCESKCEQILRVGQQHTPDEFRVQPPSLLLVLSSESEEEKFISAVPTYAYNVSASLALLSLPRFISGLASSRSPVTPTFLALCPGASFPSAAGDDELSPFLQSQAPLNYL